jgi:hypothetical protein
MAAFTDEVRVYVRACVRTLQFSLPDTVPYYHAAGKRGKKDERMALHNTTEDLFKVMEFIQLFIQELIHPHYFT